MITKGIDNKGCFAQYNNGKKYYFDLENHEQRRVAMENAAKDRIDSHRETAKIKRENKHKEKESKKHNKK